ncbi:hypothetical protein ABEF95_016646 [Exophiala dermatitidis]|nr:hypothetical protein HRR74_001172 [Exophiala dermatitidis]KAJ4527074.1 hypothetical protein HRR73_001871 [Exophiala dermatitidis]KAJ4532792.1 hypothetical protein HRR76_007772 [Exophiala dermatitidis]KAJ4538942.1 hypothetical protein HRR77_006860 [Exophiala dermatitidis]KAJ4573935.1 hypothetical protein HRR79_002944 [Exophiala dermatitidis]
MDPSWAGQEYPTGATYRNGNGETRGSPMMNMGFLKSFGGMQKKMTRDGQPAKRRGPKPDSKPAQTRRQELNRQAQRTHRERKENYIKALELELSRLRETYLHEQNARHATIQQQKLIIEDQQREIIALREILASRGIAFENELENRKAVIAMRPKREEPSLSPPSASNLSPTSMGGRPMGYQPVMSGPPSTATGYSPQTYINGGPVSVSGHSPGTTHHSHSPQGPDIQEMVFIKKEPGAVADMPRPGIGIFERDPQLGIDFILRLEHTCRDHEEYLVRRSFDSPDDEEEALFSGHALMASCPPPSHIERVPAQGGGLVPTYDHKVPDVTTVQILNNLLNLSQTLRGNEIPSGQVTPIMALQSLKGHRNYASLTREDVLGMIEAIKSKVRCYGFGAVMEDFELRDALSSVFATKPETYDQLGTDYSADIDDMYL